MVLIVFIAITLLVHLGLESQVRVCWADKHKGRELWAEETKAGRVLMVPCNRWFRGAGVRASDTQGP